MQDADYEASGAQIVSNQDAFGQDIILKVRPPKHDQEAKKFKDGSRWTIIDVLVWRGQASPGHICLSTASLASHHRHNHHCQQPVSNFWQEVLTYCRMQADQLHLPSSQQGAA